MRITFLLPDANLSGGIRVVALYAAELTRRGHRVTVLSMPPRPPSLGMRVRALAAGRRLPRPQPGPSHLDGLALDHRILPAWGPPKPRLVPDADVLIATWWETAEWVYALPPAKGAKVYFIQGYEVLPYMPAERVEHTYRLPLHKIVVSRWLAEMMRDRFDDNDVDLVPNSVDRTQFHAMPRGRQPRPTVGFLYNVAPSKGVATTLAAIAELRRKYADLRVISFGSSDPVPELPLDEGIEFHRQPAQEQLRTLYAQCDAWLSASISEGFNLPAMEAMACRTPVISTRTGWPEEAIRHGENGMLVDIADGHNAQGLAQAADRVLALSDAQWRVMSEQAFLAVADSSLARSATLFESALRRVAARNALRRANG